MYAIAVVQRHGILTWRQMTLRRQLTCMQRRCEEKLGMIGRFRIGRSCTTPQACPPLSCLGSFTYVMVVQDLRPANISGPVNGFAGYTRHARPPHITWPCRCHCVCRPAHQCAYRKKMRRQMPFIIVRQVTNTRARGCAHYRRQSSSLS